MPKIYCFKKGVVPTLQPEPEFLLITYMKFSKFLMTGSRDIGKNLFFFSKIGLCHFCTLISCKRSEKTEVRSPRFAKMDALTDGPTDQLTDAITKDPLAKHWVQISLSATL